MYRSTFEKYAEQALAHKVTVLGDADIRLLPSPAVTFTDVRVGEAEDPLLVVSRFQMRIELPALLKGEVRVLDMELDRPHLSLSLDESGRLDWLTAQTSDGALGDLAAEDVAFDRISIVDGAVSVIDARTGETHRLNNGNLLISARTLAGPFKVQGQLDRLGQLGIFRAGRLGVDQPAGVLDQRHVQGDEVGTREQLVDRQRLGDPRVQPPGVVDGDAV